MKIRLGYVSNSSSSSYYVDSTCAMGVDNNIKNFSSLKTHESYNKYLTLSDSERENWLWYEGDNSVCGISVKNMKDDETKNQFRARVFEMLKQFGYDGKIEDVDFQLPEYSGECD
ncbi:MAG: hypothetical protein IKP65_00170 [Alphaproteobacteria bacterium]|nr:hypothetical protein [Alphaproteobacteria bacterium]